MSEVSDVKVPHVGYVSSSGDKALPENPTVIRSHPIDERFGHIIEDPGGIIKQPIKGKVTSPTGRRIR